MSVFLDANCFKLYIDGITSDSNNVSVKAFSAVTSVGQFLLDEEGLFLQEWRDCTGGSSNIFVGDHIADLMQNDKIRLAKFTRNPVSRKKAMSFGIPKRDARIIEFSIATNIYLVLTHDIDFFEPGMKSCSSEKRRKYLHDRKGTVCKLIEKNFGIYVSCCCRIEEFLN